MTRRRPRTGSMLLFILLIQACGTTVMPRGEEERTFSWSNTGAEIHLQTIISSQRESGARKLTRWVRGSTDGKNHLFARPYGVAWDDEDLLVADPASGLLTRVGENGVVLQALDDEIEQPTGIAACERGIIVSDPRTGRVAILDRNLHRSQWIAENLSRPTGVACAGNMVFVVETGAHRVARIDARGSVTTFGRRGSGPGEFNYPTSIAIARSVLYVGDSLNFRIQEFDLSTGDYIESFGGLGDTPDSLPRLKGMAIDSSDHLWTSDALLDLVVLRKLDGSLLASFGRAGSGPGEFAFPAGIAISAAGRVAIADSLNARIQIFRVVDGAERAVDEEN